MSENNNNNKLINPKCSKCKCYFIQDEVKSSGLPYSTCKKCRDRGKKDKLKENRTQNNDNTKEYNQSPETKEEKLYHYSMNNIVGENREYNGSELFIDMIPQTSWGYNVRTSSHDKDWKKIREYCYKRVNFKCECCGIDCKNKRDYDELDSDSDVHESNENFSKKVELKKWNTIQLEAHERWSYNETTKIQKLERIIALCHRCHSVTHFGLSKIRGLENHVHNHLKKVNNWDDDQVIKHHMEQLKIWRNRNKINWTIDLSIIDILVQSISNLEETKKCDKCNVELIYDTKKCDCHRCENWGGCKISYFHILRCPKCYDFIKTGDYEEKQINHKGK